MFREFGPQVLIALSILGAIILYFYLRSKTHEVIIVEGEVPLGYVDFKDSITLYRRSDGLLYQKLGYDVQCQVFQVSDGSIHKLGDFLSIDINELVEIIEIIEIRY